MRPDELVTKRFAELDQKATELWEARKDYALRGSQGYTVPSPLFQGWVTSTVSLLQRVFGRNSVQYVGFLRAAGNTKGDSYQFESCLEIFRASREDYEGGYLFEIRGLVKAEVLSDALEQAAELLDAGYKDPACVVAGVALESTLKELCTRKDIPHGKADKMNADLTKAHAFNVAKQKQITAWQDLRNRAAHGDWGAYTAEDVAEMLSGVRRFVADYL